jgi:hypothetical protein
MIKTKELGVVSFCILSGNWSDAGKEKIQRAHQRDVEWELSAAKKHSERLYHKDERI